MNKLIILTIIWGMVVYCKSMNCNTTYSETEFKNFYSKKILVKCTNKQVHNNYATISMKLVDYMANISDGNYKLKSQRASSNHQCTINNTVNIDMVMEEFTPICQRYTDVMAHKYHLQHLLFHRTNDVTVIVQLTSLVTNLQVLANILQTMQMNEDNHSCVKFTPCQYKKIYYSRLPRNKPTDELDALCLLNYIAAKDWRNKVDIFAAKCDHN